jgi:predicted NBD/HSP70 family sugar kinase
LRKRNRAAVLAAMRRAATVSRTALTGDTGLSPATVSAITGELLAERVLLQDKQINLPNGRRGRPAISLAFNPENCVVGVASLKVGAVNAAIYDYTGTQIASTQQPIRTDNPDLGDITLAIGSLCEAMLAQLPANRLDLRAINVSVQGITDIAETTMIWSPMTRKRNLPIASALAARFGVPVHVGHDCNRIVMALQAMERDRLGDHFAAVLLSHGIGMGIFQDGRPLQGERSSAMEFGHLSYQPNGALCRCGRRGCIEAYAGDYAILRAARGEPGDAAPVGIVTQADFDEILERAVAGDRCALEACERAGAAIGIGIANMFALIDPFPVALVGKGAALLDFMRPSMMEMIGRRSLMAELVEPQLVSHSDDIGIILQGSAWAALEEVDAQIAKSV